MWGLTGLYRTRAFGVPARQAGDRDLACALQAVGSREMVRCTLRMEPAGLPRTGHVGAKGDSRVVA